MDDYPINFFGNKYSEPRNKISYKLFLFGVIFFISIIAAITIFLVNKKQPQTLNNKNELLSQNSNTANDSDGDGLSDDIEKIYGTDSLSKDTDNDGYDDKTEINNGYNPLGEGRLAGNNHEKIPADIDPNNTYDGLTVNGIFISDEEAELVNLVNEYRKSQNLSPVSLSKSLTYVAKIHALDIVENIADQYGKYDMHSWSNNGSWTSCSRSIDHNSITSEDHKCMHQKPIELTDYTGEGHENAIGLRDQSRLYRLVYPKDILQDWKESYGHNILMVNQDIWKNYDWSAIGVAIYKGFACIWFGENTDELGAPLSYNNCDEIDNSFYRDECFFKKAVEENDSKICNNISNKMYKEICPLRMEIYKCGKVKPKEAENNCYHKLEDLNENYCNLLYAKKDVIENCIMITAELKNDKSICEKITSPTLKQECIISTSR